MPTGLLFKGWHDPPTIHPSMTPPLPMPGSWLPSAAAPPPSRCGPGHGPSDRPARPGMGNAMSPLGSWRYPPNSEPLAENHLRSPGLLSNILQNHLDLGAKHAFWVLKRFLTDHLLFLLVKTGSTNEDSHDHQHVHGQDYFCCPANKWCLPGWYIPRLMCHKSVFIYILVYIYIYLYKHANTVKHVCTHVWAFQSNTIFPEN